MALKSRGDKTTGKIKRLGGKPDDGRRAFAPRRVTSQRTARAAAEALFKPLPVVGADAVVAPGVRPYTAPAAKVEVRSANGRVRAQISSAGPSLKTAREPAKFMAVDDLRDDCMSIVKNSGLSYAQITARGGPSAATLGKWNHRETKKPQLNTIRGALAACGMKIVFLPV